MCPGKAADLSSQLETLVKVLTYSIRYNGPLLDPEAPNPSHEVDPSEGRGLGFRTRHSALHPSMFDSCHSMLDEFKVSYCSPSFMPPDCYIKCPFLSLKVSLQGFLGVLSGLYELYPVRSWVRCFCQPIKKCLPQSLNIEYRAEISAASPTSPHRRSASLRCSGPRCNTLLV